MDQKKIYSTLGLCKKAGKVVSGEFSVLESIRDGTAKLVIISEDASDNTKKQFSDKCNFYKVPMLNFGEKELLGHAIGKDVRTSLAVTDQGLAKSLRENFSLDNTTEVQ